MKPRYKYESADYWGAMITHTTLRMEKVMSKLQDLYNKKVDEGSLPEGNFVDVGAVELCEKCHKVQGDELHECPYQVDVFDDYSYLCNCCDECERECQDDAQTDPVIEYD